MALSLSHTHTNTRKVYNSLFVTHSYIFDRCSLRTPPTLTHIRASFDGSFLFTNTHIPYAKFVIRHMRSSWFVVCESFTFLALGRHEPLLLQPISCACFHGSLSHAYTPIRLKFMTRCSWLIRIFLGDGCYEPPYSNPHLHLFQRLSLTQTYTH